MNIAIVGCGLIGEKRLNTLSNHTLLYAVDKNIKRAERLRGLKNQGIVSENWENIIDDPTLDLVIAATTNNALTEITIAALKNNKHILVEKPAGRNSADLQQALEVAEHSTVFAKVGFNHRFHPAMLKAKDIITSNEIGEIMFIRGRYGHGGRLGYEKEWRFDKEFSGGGELIDQGVHLIDLSRWLMDAEFTHVSGYAGNYFWDTDLDDNGFLQLRTATNQIAWLHVSATEWKNTFSLEIYGKYGKLQIDGLGGSYGIEKLTYYKMLPEMGPPETSSWEYPFPDKSWQRELEYFINCIKANRQPEGGLFDAKKAMDIVSEIYGGKV
ncbi:MAG: Gfo/Idh/MocA family oxidoreductase [Clostridiales bacterium]|jgi:predicted dehydrogenase|nr:Gfo/Idh/MocA family oxidoreductase [Clostridiales bacterium]